MNGSINTFDIRTCLVIGIHQKELYFGRQVAAILDRLDIRVVRIDHGLPQREVFESRWNYYSIFHREIYLQTHQQLKNKIDLLIDLHTGINETGRCADIFCADTRLLHRLRQTIGDNAPMPWGHCQSVRCVQIANASSAQMLPTGSFPICHTIIPRTVWESTKYTYVGLEIYLPSAGDGDQADWKYGARIVENIVYGVQTLSHPSTGYP